MASNFQVNLPHISSRGILANWLHNCGDMRACQTNTDDYVLHERIIQDQTQTWLFSETKYQQWCSVASSSATTFSPNVLWLYGDAGFGKSVLCAHAIRHQTKLWTGDRGVAITYQFYKMNNESETPMTAYLTLAEMLLNKRFPPLDDKVPDEIMAVVFNHPSQDELRRLIKMLIREFKVVYIFVDGLDEMVDAVEKTRWSDAKHFLEFILKLAVDPRCPEDDFDTVVNVWISSQWRREIHYAIFSHIPGTSTVSTSRPSSSITPLVQIPLTQESNQPDISAMFRRELEASKSYHDAKDEGVNFINQVLEILQPAVKGNFLWACLMLDSIRKSNSLSQILEAVSKVPDDFRTYLRNRIKAQLDRHSESRRVDAAHILSCLMYAERPLLVGELCEAVCAYRIADPGENMQEEDKPFEDKIEEICAPLVRVDQMLRQSEKVSVCTLYHSAVRGFLRDTPYVLTPAPHGNVGSDETDKYTVSPRVLAQGCMRYLWQDRYKKPLLCPPATQGRGFLTSCLEQQNINKHAFLAYCAKYWARHHEDLDTHSDKLCEEIRDFVYSSHFRTTLQVQSLFVQSRFCFMLSRGHEDKGTHLVRAFPRFFTEEWPSGKDVQKQYNEAIGDFGYYLDDQCSSRGSLTGQIERCVWGMLGSKNAFHRVSRRRQGFKLEPKQDQTKRDTEDQSQCFYHDNVGMNGGKITVFSVVLCLNSENTLRINFEQFTMKPGHRPQTKDGQFDPIIVPKKKLELYQGPLKFHTPGRPRAVNVALDGRVFRVGSEVFVLDGGSLRRVQLEALPTEERMDFFEEMSNRGSWVAIGRRRKISLTDLVEEKEELRAEATNKESGEEDSARSDGFSDSPTSSSASEGETNEEENTDSEENGIAVSRQASVQEQPQRTENQQTMENDGVESDLESVDHGTVCCSARESCSPGSTSIQSDEIIQDDDFWNDWLSDDDDLQIDDIHDDNISDELNTVPVCDSLDDIFDDVAEADDEKESESDIPSHFSGFESDAWSDSNDASDDDPVGVIFHDSRQSHPRPSSKVAEGAKKKGAHLCELLVLNTDKTAAASVGPIEEENKTDSATAAEDARRPLRVFRFAREATGLLFSSPPAIHPTHNLLVWPLGGDEVLFAHFSPTEKTFFTNLLGAGGRAKMCHVSVQVKFSPCGQYLHIACLDGAVKDNIDSTGQLTRVISDLCLRVSTYRLSRRKPTRSVPRLIYRMSCPLWPAHISGEGRTSNRLMSVTPLPWTLTWDWSDSEGGAHVYACQSCPHLHVLRVPLFADVEAREWGPDGVESKDHGDALPVFRNSEPVFLPFSALSRRVHFFPRHPGGSSSTKEAKNHSNKKSSGQHGGKGASGGKSSDRGKPDVGEAKQEDDPYVATVVVSSEDANNEPGAAQSLSESRDQRHGDAFEAGYRGRAQVAHLTRSQLGDWTRLRYSETARSGQSMSRAPTRMETWRGQLLSKYEKFDKTDDCDIVPYIR